MKVDKYTENDYHYFTNCELILLGKHAPWGVCFFLEESVCSETLVLFCPVRF
jgi:hypothetical protein